MFSRSNPQDTENMSTDISQLSSEGIIDSKLQTRFNDLRGIMLNQISNSSMPLFDIASKETSQSGEKVFKPAGNNNHSLFVEIQHVDRIIFVKKTTVTWLLQEGERVSSDRLFCVREKQPFALTAVPTPKDVCVPQNCGNTSTVYM